MNRLTLGFVVAFPVVATAGLIGYFATHDPAKVGPVGILGVFVVMYVITLSLVFSLVHVGLGLAARVLARARLTHPRAWRVGAQKAYYIASIVAFGPIFLLAVSTLGQLQFRDVALVVTFLTLATVYVLKRS